MRADRGGGVKAWYCEGCGKLELTYWFKPRWVSIAGNHWIKKSMKVDKHDFYLKKKELCGSVTSGKPMFEGV